MSPRRKFPLSKLNRKSVKIPLALAAATAAIGTAAAGSLAGPASASTGAPAVAHAQSGAARDAAVSQLFPGGGRAADLPAPHTGTVRLVVAKGKQAAPAGAQAPRHAGGAAHPRQPLHRAGQRSVCHASGLNRWICQADSILVQHGVPRSDVSASAARIVVMHESGGNPHASNGWDANAAAGTPSEGIAQTIAPTFSTYALPGHHNIWNPVDNMVAAFRYAISRYGSMNNIPGVVSVRSGGSYMGY